MSSLVADSDTPENPDRTAGPTGYYRRVSDTAFEPTRHVQGAWRDDEQHMGPASGLLAHALETVYPRPDLQLCRISYEILGVIAAERSEIEVEVIRPGRTIELLQARMVIDGRTAIRATGWRLATGDTAAAAGGAPEPLPDPQLWPDFDITDRWSGGYIDSLRVRLAPDARPGDCRAWLTTDVTLIEDEPVSDLAAFTALVDTANGLAAREDPQAWLYPNLDLTIHYVRSPRLDGPRQRWVGLDTAAVWGPDGVGLTSSTVYDRHGAVGRAEQILTLRRR